MTSAKLPQRATTAETCQWLSEQTGTPWNLARLLEHGLTAYVWIDHSDEFANLFAEGVTGYCAPVVYIEDTKRLAAGSDDVLIRLTRDSDRIAIKLKEPGMRMPLDAVRFFQRDIEQLVDALLNPREIAPEKPAPLKESLKGINKAQVLIAFGGMAKIDLEKALAGGIGIFGDDGARVRKNSRSGKNTHLWNPVTLALGLNDVYRVPMRTLKKAFATQPYLMEWRDAWRESLALLGE